MCNLSRAACIAVNCKSDSAILSGAAFTFTVVAHIVRNGGFTWKKRDKIIS